MLLKCLLYTEMDQRKNNTFGERLTSQDHIPTSCERFFAASLPNFFASATGLSSYFQLSKSRHDDGQRGGFPLVEMNSHEYGVPSYMPSTISDVFADTNKRVGKRQAGTVIQGGGQNKVG